MNCWLSTVHQLLVWFVSTKRQSIFFCLLPCTIWCQGIFQGGLKGIWFLFFPLSWEITKNKIIKNEDGRQSLFQPNGYRLVNAFQNYSHNAIRAVYSIIINCHWPCKIYRTLLPSTKYFLYSRNIGSPWTLEIEENCVCGDSCLFFALILVLSIFYWPLFNWPSFDSWNRERARTWCERKLRWENWLYRWVFESLFADC